MTIAQTVWREWPQRGVDCLRIVQGRRLSSGASAAPLVARRRTTVGSALPRGGGREPDPRERGAPAPRSGIESETDLEVSGNSQCSSLARLGRLRSSCATTCVTMPGDTRERQRDRICPPNTSRAARLRADGSAGILVNWRHCIVHRHAQAIRPAANGDQRGRTNDTPRYAIKV
jgi:hypothetical protein